MGELAMPWLRAELVGYLRIMASRQLQDELWVKHKHAPGTYTDLDAAIHFFFDDTDICSDAARNVGVAYFSAEEADLIREVYLQFDRMLNVLGTAKKDQEYLDSTYWHEVVESSRRALDCLLSNDSIE